LQNGSKERVSSRHKKTLQQTREGPYGRHDLCKVYPFKDLSPPAQDRPCAVLLLFGTVWSTLSDSKRIIEVGLIFIITHDSFLLVGRTPGVSP